MDLTPEHLDLGQLIERLKAEPDKSSRVPLGFTHPHSYRGYYEQLAFEIAEDVTVAEMLASAESALGATFQGWKGGDYTMGEYTEVWLVAREGTTGESIGVVLLELMLRDARRWKSIKDTPAYQAGREDAARDVEARVCFDCRGELVAAARGDQPRTVSQGEQGDNPEEQR